MKTAGTILVSGMLAGDPHQGGATWAVLQYVLGFQRLGYDTYVVEPLRTIEPLPDVLSYFDDVAASFDLKGRAALLTPDGRIARGVPMKTLLEVARRADLLINISGMLTDERLLSAIPVRLYLDLDPAFVQLWHAVEGIDMRFAGHTHFATVGRAIGTPHCAVPTCGLDWIKTWPPVVLEHWPVAPPCPAGSITTIGNWRGYGSIEHEGAWYGQKAHSVRALLDLPQRTTETLRLALAIHPDERPDLEALAAHHWTLLAPRDVAGTPQQYQALIRDSKAELGIAKSGYVHSRCGWFSDRSACYLASGRPVIAQETGFGCELPTGHGLFAFETVDDILTAIEAINAEFQHHCRQARTLAEDWFDSDRVLSQLLKNVGLSP